MTETFNEQGYGIIPVSFEDEDGDPAVPKSILWTLTDPTGRTIINSREQVSVTPLASSIEIELVGDDLQILSSEIGRVVVGRLLTVEIVYDSTRGLNKTAKEEYVFNVKNLKYITNPES